MFNSEMVTEYLQRTGQYPSDLTEEDYGLKIIMKNNRLLLMGDPSALIDLADLLGLVWLYPVKMQDSTGILIR